ncbi:transmembrane protein, putative [Medicago truncatula]|uniref:Transmembrane protein, putative n=1 Tax=Medicago truncatula TaxID=3880 RepID=G7JBW5_MEDTR|nr:transmembrane protein, putative [Medicago truncatula]
MGTPCCIETVQLMDPLFCAASNRARINYSRVAFFVLNGVSHLWVVAINTQLSITNPSRRLEDDLNSIHTWEWQSILPSPSSG